MECLIFSKMIEVMRQIGAIGKGQENTFHHYKYRGIDDIYNALGPIMSEVGVFMTSEVLDHSHMVKGDQRLDTLVMEYTFWATDGSHISTTVVGEGADKGDKSVYKALAGAHKYALLQTFVVPTADVKDAEADSPDLTDKPKGVTTFDPPAEDGKDGAVSGQIEALSKKKTAKGGDMWSVKVQGVWASTFKAEDGAELQKAHRENLPIGMTYEISGKYRNVVSVVLLGQPEEEQLLVDEPPAHDDSEVPF